MKRIGIGLLGLLLAATLWAAGPSAVRKRAEASMVVTGSIEVAPDGAVHGYTLDRPGRLPPEVASLVAKSIAQWHFAPPKLAGPPAIAKARMSLRIVARRQDNGNYLAAIRGAYFGDEDAAAKASAARHQPPQYPRDALRARVGGAVYLLLKIDRAGQVTDAVAQQVNLYAMGSDREMQRWRDLLADAAIEAAKHWDYGPASGPHADEPYWVARVPVKFFIRAWGDRAPAPGDDYGKWELYIPGPLQPAPWAEARHLLAGDVDALPDGGIFPLDQHLQLQTALDNS